MALFNISKLNPVRFYISDLQTDTKYFTKYNDEYMLRDNAYDFQNTRSWLQPWQQTDTIKIQIQSDTTDLSLTLIDCLRRTIKSVPFVNKMTPWHDEDKLVYEAELALTDVPNGQYYLTIQVQGSVILASDMLEVYPEQDNTILFEYSNRRNKLDFAFDTGIIPATRIPAALLDFTVASDDTMYIDQYRNVTVLNSIPYATYQLIIGDARGVPDWVADNINRIFGLSHVLVDGRAFSKNQDAKMQRTGDRLYQMAGWSLEITESINKDGTAIDFPTRIVYGGEDFAWKETENNETLLTP